MLELSNRKIDEYGNVVFEVSHLFPLILKGYDVTKFLIHKDDETDKFESVCKMLDNDEMSLNLYEKPSHSVEQHFEGMKEKWFIPSRYRTLGLRHWLLERCTSDEQRNRVKREMDIFEKYELENMLRSLIYLVDVFRENKIVWGVGRGSSVSSYVLFLIGIHRVDSIRYQLDFSEFLS